MKTTPYFGHSTVANGSRDGAASLLRMLRKSGPVVRRRGLLTTTYYPKALSGWIVVVPIK